MRNKILQYSHLTNEMLWTIPRQRALSDVINNKIRFPLFDIVDFPIRDRIVFKLQREVINNENEID